MRLQSRTRIAVEYLLAEGRSLRMFKGIKVSRGRCAEVAEW
jgi:hypothetical protein